MKKLLIIATIFSAILLSSCSTQRISLSGTSREVPKTNPHYSYWDHFFLGGIGQTQFHNAVELCKNNNGAEFIETRLSFAQGLVTGLTYSIYAPRTVNIYCKDN